MFAALQPQDNMTTPIFDIDSAMDRGSAPTIAPVAQPQPVPSQEAPVMQVEDAPETPAPVETEEAERTPDGIDKYFEQLGNEKAPEWDENSLKPFKGTFGDRTPQEVLQEYNTMKETLEQSKGESERSKKVLSNIDNMPFELAQALKAQAEGKDYKPFLKELASGVSLSKAAKDVDKFALVDKHYPGKFTEEQKQAIRDGLDDDQTERFNDFHDRAADKHDTLRKQNQEVLRAQQVQEKQSQEAFQKSSVAAIAYMKSTPALNALLQQAPPDVQEKFLSGRLEDELLYNADGTRKADSLALLIKGSLFDTFMTRAKEGAYANGKLAKDVKDHSKLLDTPPPQQAARTPAPKAQERNAQPTLPPKLAEFMGG